MYGYLMHHGVKGMKWGIRRYQNPDGSLTPAGRERYGGGKLTITSSKKEYRTSKEHPFLDNADEIHTVFEYKGSNKKSKDIDNLAKNEDYYEATDKFSRLGTKIIRAYKNEGKSAVKKLLKNEGYNIKLSYYETKYLDEMYDGYVGTGYSLKAIGNDYVFGFGAETDNTGWTTYTDEEYFSERKK